MLYSVKVERLDLLHDGPHFRELSGGNWMTRKKLCSFAPATLGLRILSSSLVTSSATIDLVVSPLPFLALVER